MADPTAKGIKAGEAYLRAIANDPESKRALMRTRAYLQTFISLANVPEIREALEGHLQVSHEHADALRDNRKRIGDQLGALHLPRPDKAPQVCRERLPEPRTRRQQRTGQIGGSQQADGVGLL